MPVTKTARTLTCCCCGASTKGRQWWNRDAGYGVCVGCGESAIAKEGEAAAKSYYGERGIHWDVDYKPAAKAAEWTPPKPLTWGGGDYWKTNSA